MQMKDEEQQQQEQTQLQHYQQGKTFPRPAGCAYTTATRQGMFLLIYIYIRSKCHGLPCIKSLCSMQRVVCHVPIDMRPE